ncbi:MAG: hypothetical protein WCJ64_07035 [Rhodospirillaceae bacterium]
MRAGRLLAILVLALAGCGGDAFVHASRAPVIEIVPGVSAPSAPVVTVLRTQKVNPPRPDVDPDDLNVPESTVGPMPMAPMPMAPPQMAPTPLQPPSEPRQPRG